MSKNNIVNIEKLSIAIDLATEQFGIPSSDISQLLSDAYTSERKPSKRYYYEFSSNFFHIYELYCRYNWLFNRKLLWHQAFTDGTYKFKLYVLVNKKERQVLELSRQYE